MMSHVFMIPKMQLTGSFIVSCIHYAVNINHADMETKAG